MMTCEDFEMLMADALGGELSPADRPVFEAHLAECEDCRREYESASKTVSTMRELPGPERLTIRREGDRLVIDKAPARVLRSPWWSRGGVLRYAASILIAFTAGYALHAGLLLTGDTPSIQVAETDGQSGTKEPGTTETATIQVADTSREHGTTEPGIVDTGAVDAGTSPAASPTNLQRALVNTHARNPSRSGLAKCLIAMANAKE